MDSIENGATIRIGFERYDNFVLDITVKTLTYSLKIDKKTIIIHKGGGTKEYREVLENAAKEIAQRMNDKKVKDYIIYNGERVKMSNYAWVSCDDIPNDGVEIFRKTLIDCLDGVE